MIKDHADSFRRRFFERLANPWDLGLLFDYLPDTYFYAKNAQGRFVMANRALARLLAASNPEAMIGKTDYDFSPRDLADQYVAEDRRVMETLKPVTFQAWLIPNHRGTLKWFLSSKIPLFGRNGKVIGIAGAMRDVEKAGDVLASYRRLEPVLTHLFTRYEAKIDFHRLARLVPLSLSQLDRRFKRLFQLSPQQFLQRVRVHAACRMLSSTDQRISQIALQIGYYDQSYFTKQFQRRTGMTPLAYRRKYRKKEDIPLLQGE
ncbi:MAG: AraC family transcriptional regulator [Pirellulales bacterium]|nr:AraC family transcriptional regulator [Pirellulales bacterium]